jgi:hypothetical protein
MRPLCAGILAALLLTGVPVAPALAQACGPGDLGDIDRSCRGLWLERNRVYAQAGYCFQSPDAIAVFGRGCFPPYGRLSRDDKCYVDAIQALERRQGCR